MTEIKFCGLTRAEDATAAAELGASYIGVVFASGPRRQTVAAAAAIFAGAPDGIPRAGVFGTNDPSLVAESARALNLAVVQLHGDPNAADVEAVRAQWSGAIWAAVRVSGSELPTRTRDLFAAADGVLLDARVEGALGGSGVALAWAELAAQVVRARRNGVARLVLAGGLRAENVARAIGALHPDVVDVSSGVESTVGIKDRERMRAFRDAVRAAGNAA